MIGCGIRVEPVLRRRDKRGKREEETSYREPYSLVRTITIVKSDGAGEGTRVYFLESAVVVHNANIWATAAIQILSSDERQQQEKYEQRK